MKKATIINLMTGAEIPCHLTTDHPDCHYGKAVWVGDDDNVAYLQDGLPNPFYSIKR